jgi:hypothetical protein
VTTISQALKWYSEAVRKIRERMRSKDIDLFSSCLSCILFVSFEFQQSSVVNALKLVECGFALLSQLNQSRGELKVHEGVTNFFAQHAMLMLPLSLPKIAKSSPVTEENLLRVSVLSSMGSLGEARNELYKLMHETYGTVRDAKSHIHEPEKMQFIIVKQQSTLERLRS